MDNVKQSLYVQLVEKIRELIEKELKPHDLLPSERELSEIYSVSRTTVRSALQELENVGLIYKRQGKGTFVSSISENTLNLLGAYSFTEQMNSLGKVAKTTILEFEIIESNKYLSGKLGIHTGSKIFKIKRLRLADGKPMMLERTYLPFKRFESLTKKMLDKRPMYEVFLETYSEKIKYAEEEFYASIVSSKDTRFLEVFENSPVLNLVRKTFNIDNEVIEYTLSVARADHFRYKILHNRA